MKTIRRLACATIGTLLLLSLWFVMHSGIYYSGGGLLRNINSLRLKQRQYLQQLNLTSNEPEKINLAIPLSKSAAVNNTLNTSDTNNVDVSIQELATIFQTPWKHNVSKVQSLRYDLEKVIHSEMILSQNNSNKLQVFRYLYTQANSRIDPKLYKMLPKVSPMQPYKVCSVVGNGGILNGSKCGSEIDRADFVIRCNAPPINAFREDAGVKSNITTLNPSIVFSKFKSIRLNGDKSKFIKEMKQYNNFIWFPSFAKSYILKLSLKVNELFQKSKDFSVRLLHGNPNHFREVGDYWRSRGIKKRLSTGFYMATAALSLCDEVHLYGFWPFSTDMHNRSRSYHYYGGSATLPTLVNKVHSFNDEFNELVRLHNKGVLQLHVDDCFRNS